MARIDAILLSELKQQIADFRHTHWAPPESVEQVSGLPIFYTNDLEFQNYRNKWKELIIRAHELYDLTVDQVYSNFLELPSTLNLPIFINDIYKVRLTKTTAKESKTFYSTAELQVHCGEFSSEDISKMEHWLESVDQAALVAHRPFVDLRAYLFQNGREDPLRLHYYTNGLVIGVDPNQFEIIDARTEARTKPRKVRSDSFANKPELGKNSQWHVYQKIYEPVKV